MEDDDEVFEVYRTEDIKPRVLPGAPSWKIVPKERRNSVLKRRLSEVVKGIKPYSKARSMSDSKVEASQQTTPSIRPSTSASTQADMTPTKEALDKHLVEKLALEGEEARARLGHTLPENDDMSLDVSGDLQIDEDRDLEAKEETQQPQVPKFLKILKSKFTFNVSSENKSNGQRHSSRNSHVGLLILCETLKSYKFY